MRPDFSKIDYTAPAQSATAASTDAKTWMTNEQIAVKPIYTAADLAGMEHHHIALAADPRRLLLDQENVGRRVGKGIADELVEGGGHEGRVVAGVFRRSKRCGAGGEAKTSRERVLGRGGVMDCERTKLLGHWCSIRSIGNRGHSGGFLEKPYETRWRSREKLLSLPSVNDI